MTKDAQSYSVLVAEDNLINQKVLGALLKKWGYNISIVSNGVEVLEEMVTKIFDIVILDYQMPKMNGLQTIQAIRKSFDTAIKCTPVVLLTSEINQSTLQKLQDVGISNYLKKPIDPDILYHALQEILTKTDKPKRKTAAQVNYLKKITDGNKQLMAEIISLFIEEMPSNINKMKNLCLMEDWESLHKLIHKTRSNYKYVSLDESENMLRDFEIDLERQANTETYLSRIIALERITLEAIERLSIKKEKLLR